MTAATHLECAGRRAREGLVRWLVRDAMAATPSTMPSPNAPPGPSPGSARAATRGAGLNVGDRFSHALALSLDAPLLFEGDGFVRTDLVQA